MSSAKAWKDQQLGNGRYHLVGKLGEGGMGIVYRAWDRNLGIDVCIKAPKFSQVGDDQAVRRFLREIRSLVNLTHPHVVRILDVGEHAGLPFAVMEFLPGGCLKTRCALGGDGQPRPQPPETLHTWLPHLAVALDFVHARGYLHRDVKPPNILYDGHGNAYLSDFGLAKGLAALGEAGGSQVTGVGQFLGTPLYMAPELFEPGVHDGRVDQYALAMTVYEVLAGRHPLAGLTLPMLVMRSRDPSLLPNLGQSAPAAPPDLCRAVHRALSVDPAQRYPSCEAFTQAVLAGVARPARASVAWPSDAPTPPAVAQPATPHSIGGAAVETPSAPEWTPAASSGRSGAPPPLPPTGAVGPGGTLGPAARPPQLTLTPPPALPSPPPSPTFRGRRAAQGGGGRLLWALVALAGVVVLCVILLILLVLRGAANRKTTVRWRIDRTKPVVVYDSLRRLPRET